MRPRPSDSALDDPRESMRVLPRLLQPFLTWVTGKPLDGQQQRVRWTPRMRLFDTIGMLGNGVGLGALVVGVGGAKWWEARQITAANAAGARYFEASRLADEGKAEEAIKSFGEIAKTGPHGYRALAELRTSGALAKAGKPAEAIAGYEAVAARSGADPLFADFARLQIAWLKLDSADWTEMQNRLNALAGDKSAWRYSARELLGLRAA